MCHVLIIEDEPMIAMLIQDVLEEAGATSFSFAVTEQEAVDAALDRAPGLITSDVTLLEGTGTAAVRRIVADLGEVPVMFITASPSDCLHSAGRGIVLKKPVRAAELAGTFRQLAPV